MNKLCFLTSLSFFCGHLNAAIVENIDIKDDCTLHIEYHFGKDVDLKIPSIGETIEVDLDGEKIIKMSCDYYGGGSKEKTFCIVRTGMHINKLNLFNRKDPFGDGPACKAE